MASLWLLPVLVVPALQQTGLAPLLIEEIDQRLRPLLVCVALLAALLQLALLVFWQGPRRAWRQRSGQLLVAAAALAAVFLLLRLGPWLTPGLQNFCYMALAACGLLLLLQPVQGGGKP
ncbi:TPA: hypothetical protein ACQJWO_005684 [Klebsiella pneumoniae]